MSDDLTALFNIDAAPAAAAAAATVSINQSAGNLPSLSDIGKGVYQEMRSGGNVDVSFIALGTHASKDSVIITAAVTNVPGSCKDIRLDEAFGVFQATSQGLTLLPPTSTSTSPSPARGVGAVAVLMHWTARGGGRATA